MKSLKDRLWHYAEHELLHWAEADADPTGAYKLAGDIIVAKITKRHLPITRVRASRLMADFEFYAQQGQDEARRPYFKEVADRIRRIIAEYDADMQAEQQRRAQRHVEAGR